MKTTAVFDPAPQISQELKLPERAVRAVIQLLSEGSTVPLLPDTVKR